MSVCAWLTLGDDLHAVGDCRAQHVGGVAAVVAPVVIDVILGPRHQSPLALQLLTKLMAVLHPAEPRERERERERDRERETERERQRERERRDR